jgi:hypothetical protein
MVCQPQFHSLQSEEGSMKIPEVRAELFNLAATFNMPRLAELAEQLKRRPYVHRSRKVFPQLTDEQKRQIRMEYRDNREPYTAIAVRWNTSIGRVSEALRGKRT